MPSGSCAWGSRVSTKAPVAMALPGPGQALLMGFGGVWGLQAVAASHQDWHLRRKQISSLER